MRALGPSITKPSHIRANVLHSEETIARAVQITSIGNQYFEKAMKVKPGETFDVYIPDDVRGGRPTFSRQKGTK